MKMSTRVFVGGLTYRIKERDLEKFFRKYGRIREVSMKNGFAFVEFDDYRDAEDAIYELNGRDLMGEKISVERARGTPRGSDQWRGSGRGGGGGGGGGRGGDSYRGYGGAPPSRSTRENRDKYGPLQRTKYRVYVENLSSRISWQDLKDYMRQAGEVTFADAHKQRKNEGIVEFASYKDLKNVLEKLDGTDLNGRKIKLVEDRNLTKRSRTESSSRSRSRSRSRSGSKRSKSRSRSPAHDGSCSPSDKSKDKNDSRAKSLSRSRSRSKSRSRSQSPESSHKEDN